MYIHYRENGEIEPAYINRIGVGQYDAAAGSIEAENYYEAIAAEKNHCGESCFEMKGLSSDSRLVYSHVMNMPEKCEVTFRIASDNPGGGFIEVWRDDQHKYLMGRCQFSDTNGEYTTVKCQLNNATDPQTIRLSFKGEGDELLRLDWIHFE